MQPSERVAGSIYDLGYRTYDGLRLGRRYAVLSLFNYSLRSAFGLGRRTPTKIIPFTLTALVFIPAAIQLGIAAVVSDDITVFTHYGYYGGVELVLMLFAAAVAPELVSRDQRTRALSLYFSRALQRSDYAAAKTLALVAAMLVLTLGPQILLFFGRGLATESLPDYMSENAGDVFPIVTTALLLSGLASTLGIAIAAQTPRRAYATIGILAAFMLTGIFAEILGEISGTTGVRIGALLSPFDVAEGLTYWLFDQPPSTDSTVDLANFAGWMWGAAVLAYIVGLWGIIFRRYERISA